MSTTQNSIEAIAVNERKAAAMLGVSPNTVKKLRKAGEIQPMRVGDRMIRYRVDELKAWALKQQVTGGRHEC